MPRMPGWFEERPPPSVLSAGFSGLSKRSRWSFTKSFTSPFLQKPRSSRITATVIENES